jgi:hypothetical protein
MHARISAFLVALALAFTGIAAAQERFGSLQGKVTDEQGQPVPGVAVTVTDVQSGAARTFVTDANGQYVAPDLNPGRYNVSFELAGFTKVERKDLSVVLGRTFQLDTQMKVGAITETVQVTAQAAPLVDTRSTLIAHNVSAEEFDRLPKTRTFQSIALASPSVNSGDVEGGIQVNGASGAENGFTVDGIVTNSLVNGQSRQNTVFEYLQEVQVKTTGIGAEYGGALGGVVSAVTKSGGNSYRGEAHYYFEGSALAAKPVKRLVLDPATEATFQYIQDEKSPTKQNEFGGSIGGPIVKNRLFFYGSYSPRNNSTDQPYTYTQGGNNTINRSIWTQQLFGKASVATKRLNATYSVLWTPTTANGTLAAYNGNAPNTYVGASSSLNANVARGYEQQQVNQSGTADFSLSNNAILSVRGGVFHDRYSDTGIPNVTSYTYQATTAGVVGLPANLQGGVGTSNTPRAQITGFDTTDQTLFNTDYSHLFNAGGLHTLKGGYALRHVVNDINSYYPGGYVNIFWGRVFTATNGQIYNGGTGAYGYYEVNDRKISSQAGSNIHSLYVQDQWTVGNRLTLNIGIRTENEKVPTFRPDYQKYAFQFGWADKLAPRLGAAYDLFADGRVKLFGSWGRYYDWTKYDLPRGSFGAETWCIYYRGLSTTDLGSLSLANMPGPDLWSNQGSCRDRRVPSFGGSIDPNTKPMSQDSTSAGVEYQLNNNSVLTLHYVHNNLRETIEDIGFLTPQGDEGYVIGNPGVGLGEFQFPTGATPGGQPIPRPKRVYDAFEIGVDRRLANNYFFSANYTFSKLRGNYAGLASSDEITTPTTGVSSATAQQQAGSISRPGGNVNRSFDLDELLWDAHGHLIDGNLATDRPHVFKLYGSYQAPFRTQFGAFFYGGSGTPVTTYLETANTSGGVGPMVNGRGDLGRTPVLTRTDVLVSHEMVLSNANRLRFEFNVLNVFNQKTATHIFNSINRGAGVARQSSAANLSSVDLTKGYDYNALILATPDGANAYDPRYKQEDLFQQGARAYFDIKYIF